MTGANASAAARAGAGTVPRLRTVPATFAVLYDFATAKTDGVNPNGGLYLNAGNSGELYGTAQYGGAGFGTVFALTPTGERAKRSHYSEATLYPFAGGTDGAWPIGTLTADANGVLYGVTSAGGGSGCGRSGCGTIYSLVPSTKTETTLHRFTGADGSKPLAGLLLYQGTLYGTTSGGGTKNHGTVFAFSLGAQSGTGFTSIYSFANSTGDGGQPLGPLTLDGGILYGTVSTGGQRHVGGIFQLSTSGSQTMPVLIHSFQYTPGQDTNDGAQPRGALLAQNGSLIGTTIAGGTFDLGVVYSQPECTSGCTDTVLHTFEGGSDGAAPAAGLTANSKGVLFGTTSQGGAGSCGSGSSGGCGTIYQMHRSGSRYRSSSLEGFDGGFPLAELLLVNGALFGTTAGGGIGASACRAELEGCGVVFEYR